MARRRLTVVKLVVAIPVFYFCFVGFFVTFTGKGMVADSNLDDGNNKDILGNRNIRNLPVDHLGNSIKHSDNNLYKGQNDNNGAIHNDNNRNWEFQPPPKEWKPYGDHKKDDEDPPVLQKPSQREKEEIGQRFIQAQEKRRGIDRAINGPSFNQKLRDVSKEFKPTKPADYNPQAPGENGKAVNIDKDKLSKEERKIFDKGFQNNAFNQYASDMMSLHRTLPDVRDPLCKKEKFEPNLPDTSVVIIFHNEAFTVLLRTVHSVLDRSPPHLLKEVILVDDFSDFDHLHKPLENYIEKNFTNVRIVRGKKREGLIRARLLGASVAKGTVITYLDSHCECAEGWLEPLLSRIAQNESNVVTPVIDVIDDETLRYQYSSAKSTSVGGFDWNLQFNWHSIPENERKRRKSDIDPVRSPTMAGGLFAMHRGYFEHLGAYDPGMDIWGGENLELSFRIWMCGGSLEIIPCSHVGHIFRKRSPYSWKTGTGVNVVKKNSIRLAEVWMDEYKNYYYERFNHDLGNYGDVSARKALRKKLHCKSFDWYIKNIFPDLFVPGEAVASGEIANKADKICLDSTVPHGTGLKLKLYPCHGLGGNQIRNKVKAQCLDSPVDSRSMQKPIKMWPCHNQGGNQYWMFSKSGEIRRDEGCMDYAGQFVMVYPCHGMKGNQEWIYGPDNSLRHRNTNLCMELTNDGNKVEMKACTGVDRQIWYWKRRDPDSKKPRHSQNDS